MAITNEVITNRLDKKINYGVARTAYGSVKSPVQEAIGSPSPNPAHDLWIDSDAIPAAMPQTNTTDLLIYKYKSSASAGSAIGNSSGVIELTLDTTVATGRSYLACSTLNDATTRLPGWVGFGMFGAQYLTKIVIATSGYHGQNFDLSGATYYKVIQPGASGYEYYFDVDAGVLVFAGTSGVPTELSSGRSIYLSSGARYRGRTGIKNYVDVDTSGNLTVTGNLTVAGTTTTQNSTTTVLSDPVLTLGGNVALSIDDNKDRGIQFRWHDGTADVIAGSFVTSTEYTITATGNTDFTLIGAADSSPGTVFTATGAGTGTGTANATANSNMGFIGYDDSAGNLMFIPDATDTSGVFTGTQGGFTGSEYIAYNLGSAPGTTTDKLYNVSGTLYWNGQTVATGTAVADLVGLTDTNIINPADGQVLTYDLTSTKWVNAAGVSTLTEDIFTGDGTTVIFDVTNDVIAEANLLITVDGIVQPNSAWTLTNDASGDPKRVTLSGAPLTGQTIRMLNVGISTTQTMVPSTGSVTASMLSSQLKEFAEDEFTTVNASTVNFDCGTDLLSETSIIVTIDGVTQPSTAFSLSTDAGGVNQRRVVLSVAPETGANIRVLNLGMTNSAGSLSAGVVNATHLAPALKNFYDKTFTGDGTTVNYDMDYDILAHGRDLLITVDGIVQTETTHYTIGNDGSSNQRRVIFGSAPITGTAIRIMHLGVVTASPSIASKIEDGDGDTYITTEATTDVDALDFYTGSTERMSIDSAGTVTIAGNLDVAGSTTTGIGIILTPTSTPSGPTAGQMYYDSTADQVQFYNGSEWGSMGGVEGIVDNSNATAITIGSDESVTLAGDLIVTGTTTTINSTSLFVEDINIELGKVTTPTDGTADGGGIVLKGASDKTILWANSTDTWDFNQGIIATDVTTPGTVSASGGDSGDWNTAYGWGDHSGAGYATSGGAITGSTINGTEIVSPATSNLGVGIDALDSITTGDYNTAVGDDASTTTTVGGSNSAFGYQALKNNISGGNNVAIGFKALFWNSGAHQNTAIGVHSLQNTSGSNNTGIGYYAGAAITSGTDNIVIGYSAGDNITTGDNNIIIGSNIDADSATNDNQLNIGGAIKGDLSTGNVDIESLSGGFLQNTTTTIEGTISEQKLVMADTVTLTNNLTVNDRLVLTQMQDDKYGLDAHVKLLIHSDTTDGSTTFTDSSRLGTHTITASGNVHHEVDQYKFGATSIFIPDASGDTLDISASDDFLFPNDFTIDMWVYVASGGDRSFYVSSNGSTYLAFNYSKSDTQFNLYLNSSGVTTTSEIDLVGWNHVAWVRHGSTLSLYVNGISIHSITNSSTLGYSAVDQTLNRLGGGAVSTPHYCDEVRISHIARWTADFTPPYKAYQDSTPAVITGGYTITGSGTIENGLIDSTDQWEGSTYINTLGTVLEGTLTDGVVNLMTGHIIQRVDATLTNITTGEITGGQANAVADAIGQITITPGNGVLIYWTTRLTTTAGTNCLSAVRIAEGTVASVGTVLKSQYFGTTGDPGYGTYHAPSIWFYDSSPASTTPNYVLLTEPQSGSTQGVSSYGPPDNACMLFEVVQ